MLELLILFNVLGFFLNGLFCIILVRIKKKHVGVLCFSLVLNSSFCYVWPFRIEQVNNCMLVVERGGTGMSQPLGWGGGTSHCRDSLAAFLFLSRLLSPVTVGDNLRKLITAGYFFLCFSLKTLVSGNEC